MLSRGTLLGNDKQLSHLDNGVEGAVMTPKAGSRFFDAAGEVATQPGEGSSLKAAAARLASLNATFFFVIFLFFLCPSPCSRRRLPSVEVSTRARDVLSTQRGALCSRAGS